MTRPTLGAVVIGRNEGDRLKACLRSLVPLCARVVYVDSGSGDDSVAFARGLGVTVVELDTSTPFTAARARNAGFEALLAGGELDLVQFVDGDCKVEPGWLAAGVSALAGRIAHASTTGRAGDSTDCRKKAVSSSVSVPCVITSPATSGSASQ